MGTDIHMAAEVRNRQTGRWELVKDKIFPNVYFNPSEPEDEYNQRFTFYPYTGRSYNLFAVLADVRNGTGFAGCVTGDKFNPISAPKGYPKNMSDELKEDLIPHDAAYYEDEQYDTRPHLSHEHSASYLTLKELLDFDWKQIHSNIGILPEEEYANTICKGIYPHAWCGMIMGQDVVVLTEKQMRNLLQGTFPRDDSKKYYVQCKFPSRTYAIEAGGFFYKEIIPILKTLIPAGGKATDVRIVFDFDS